MNIEYFLLYASITSLVIKVQWSNCVFKEVHWHAKEGKVIGSYKMLNENQGSQKERANYTDIIIKNQWTKVKIVADIIDIRCDINKHFEY